MEETKFSINYLLRDIFAPPERKSQGNYNPHLFPKTIGILPPQGTNVLAPQEILISPTPATIHLSTEKAVSTFGKWPKDKDHTLNSKDALLGKWLYTLRATTYHFMEQLVAMEESDTLNCIFSRDCKKVIKGKGNMRRHLEWHLRRIEESATRRKDILFCEEEEQTEETNDLSPAINTDLVFEGVL